MGAPFSAPERPDGGSVIFRNALYEKYLRDNAQILLRLGYSL